MTRRATDFLAGSLTGMLAAVVLCTTLTPTPMAWSKEPVPTSRPAPQADRSDRHERMTMEPSLPSPDSAGLAGTPDVTPAPASASPVPGRTTPSPTIGTRPASTREPRTSHSLRGTATWFRSPAGVSAAGPALRAAIGPSWRGTRVLVCGISTCVRTVLGDWCACGKGRVIDLHAPLFAQLAPLSKGVQKVTVKW